MKDAEVIEQLARLRSTRVHGHDTAWRSFVGEAREQFAVCVPAIRESCAAVCDVTPLSDACAAAIRALQLPTPHDGMTDTSHHAVRPFCPCCGGKMRLTSAGKFGCDDCCVYWSESELAERGSSAGESEVPGRWQEPTEEELPCCDPARYDRGECDPACVFLRADAASPAPPHQGGKSE